jgi:copper(I)-binding protein
MKSRLLTTMLLLLVSLPVVFGLMACSSNTATKEAAQTDTTGTPVIEIQEAWSRSTPEEAAGITYMTIVNNGDTPDKLIAGKTPVAAFCELHETSVDENGVMRMRGVKGGYIEIPAHGSAKLEPAGLHVMLVDLKEPLKSDTVFPLTLKFEKAGEITIDVPVLEGNLPQE